jgi:hypothetical protein
VGKLKEPPAVLGNQQSLKELEESLRDECQLMMEETKMMSRSGARAKTSRAGLT